MAQGSREAGGEAPAGSAVGGPRSGGTRWSPGVVLTSVPSATTAPSRPRCYRTFAQPCGDRCAATPPAEGRPAAALAASGTGSFTGRGCRGDRSHC